MTIKPITRTLVAALAILAIAVPAAAAEPACVTVTIDHYGDDSLVAGSPYVADVDWTDGAPHYALNGSFVWFDFGATPSAGEADTLSFDVSDPDVVSATACDDGSVTIDRVQPEPVGGDPVPDVAPPSESPLTPVCEVHGDVLEHYCTLPNRTLVIS